jgi:hypothetical protein
MTDNFLDDIDLEADAKMAIPADAKLAMLKNLADHYEVAEANVRDAEDALKKASELFRRIREELIPEKMKELGVKRFVLEDGSELGYKEFYAGKILDEDAYTWLEANGYAGAVKQELRLTTNRMEKARLEYIMEFMAKRPEIFSDMDMQEKQSVHHMTLGTIIKDLTKSGKSLPQNLIETFIGNRATLKGAKPNG